MVTGDFYPHCHCCLNNGRPLYPKIKKENKIQMKTKIKALSDCVVIRPEEPASETPGGIALPQNTQNKPQRGTVVAIGPGTLLKDGTRADVQVKEGDIVIYSKYSGTEVEVNDETLLVIRQNDLLLVEELGVE